MVIIATGMECLSINLFVILTCLIQHISCVLRVDTGATAMTKTLLVDSQNVTKHTANSQVNQDEQVLNVDEINDGINNDREEQISSSGFYSDRNFIGDNRRTDNGSEHQILKNNIKVSLHIV